MHLQELKKEKYAGDFRFQDPIAKYRGIDNFSRSLAALRTLFKVDFTLHSTVVTGDSEITTRQAFSAMSAAQCKLEGHRSVSTGCGFM